MTKPSRVYGIVLPFAALSLALLGGCPRTPEPVAASPDLVTAPPAPPPAPPAPPTTAATAAELAFRDAVDAPPPRWNGPVFHLSHDYPTTPQTCEAPWLKRKVDFKAPKGRWDAAWKGYVQDIIDYVRKGQEADLPNSPGWRAEVDGKTRWFHVPWMAYDGQRGREFVHGLTNELSTAESTFKGPGRGTGGHHLPGAKKINGVDPLFETWSVGFYNPCGAATLGAGWPTSGEPARIQFSTMAWWTLPSGSRSPPPWDISFAAFFSIREFSGSLASIRRARACRVSTKWSASGS